MKKPTILVLIDYFRPGYKAGGAIQSIDNLVQSLGEKFNFHIVTRDRDIGDTIGYKSILPDKWINYGFGQILYIPEKKIFRRLNDLLTRSNYDILYLNSFFSYKFSILPLIIIRLNRIKQRIILAPRGELMSGALKIKVIKKSLFLFVAKILGIYKLIIFHASNNLEKDYITRFWPENKILVASDIPRPIPGSIEFEKIKNISPQKVKGELHLVFLSRISPKKNLYGALKALMNLPGNVSFDIYGDYDNSFSKNYQKKCENLISKLPANIKVSFKGFLPYDLVLDTLSHYQVFFYQLLLKILDMYFGRVWWPVMSLSRVGILPGQICVKR